MSRQSEPPLEMEIRPSGRMRQAIVFVHLFAGGACFACSLAISIKFGLCVLICLHLWLLIKGLSRQHYQIKYSGQSGWGLAANFDSFEPVQILKSTLITTFIIILHLKTENNNKLTILIVNDGLYDDNFRRFIVKLKTTSKEKQEHIWRL